MTFSCVFKNSLVGLSLLFSSLGFSQQEEVKSLPLGEAVPLTEKELVNIDGKMMSLKGVSATNGVLVVFSCNTCPFVVGSDSFEGWEKQYVELNKFAQENGFKMVLINSNEGKRDNDDSLEAMKNRAKEKGYTMPYLLDKNSELADAFGARTTPHVYLINEKMELIYTGAIDNKVDSKRKSDENYLRIAIESKVANKPIELNSTPPRGCSIKRVKK
ncbi:alkyl hydroperoxide reductase/ Thiol specific antioxidant/ Mal allergen [Fluviicola taffensis DSM 16823]|uniref:Alkyl hydroperoxide reductase/ Thiol specific antioxidant/ Mal allergen n=1 Tax=Fluviicola taffensis (strain DSM 16823 / NCIMB 13979 / RW262) TaxID=755732 RepID=F2IEG9_FLUTR|nr:alkyl hydroperoxide reductase/ Thiol specific antioxidant/ Mal allergen [Fluviicola taffensis DSM 16823]